ncbi:MAG TPA: CHAT domain-containing tetratricopeptide repeat protein [Blastocatellia bacterium]|nr:CHAT domain-containing tetratricopeptide repeat protein [Blastocatellia bacterium]
MLNTPFGFALISLVLLSCLAAITIAQNRQPAPAEAFRLANKLLQAKTPEERQALLAENKELVSVPLQRFILDRGDSRLAAGEYAKALDAFQLALDVAGRIDDREGIAASHSNLGSVYYFQGDYDRAAQSYEEARKRYGALGKPKEAATSIFNLGLAAKAKGNVPAALDHFRLAHAEYERLGLAEQAAEALHYIGTIHIERGDYAAAAELFGKSGAGAANLLKIGEALYEQQEYEHALEFYRKALAGLQQQGNAAVTSAGIMAATGGIANSYYAIGDYEPALETYQKLLKLRERAGDQAGVAAALQSIGNCLYALGDLDSALENYQPALRLAEAVRNVAIIAETLGGIGNVYYSQGETALALEFYQKSLAQFETAGDQVGMRRMLRGMANSHFRLGNYDQALAAFERCLLFAKAAGDKDEAAGIRLGIGLVFAVQARFAEALENYGAALAQFEAAGSRSQAALALYRIALVYTVQSDYPQALKYAERSAELAAQAESLDTLWRAQFEIGRIEKRQDHPAEARKAFEQSVATVERMRVGFSGSEQEGSAAPYVALVGLLAEQGNSVEAFGYAERAKAQTLWDILHGSRALTTRTMLPAEIEREQKMRREITATGARLSRARQRQPKDEATLRRLDEQWRKARAGYVAFVNRLYVAHPRLKVYRGDGPPLRPEEAGGLLPDARGALVEYVVADDRAYVFVLTREQKAASTRQGRVRAQARPARISLQVGQVDIGANDLFDRVIRFRQSIANREGGWPAQARELYRLLLEPAQDELSGKTSLTIIPDGVLWSLPFSALQPADGRLLIEGCVINTVSSLTALREMRKPAAAARIPNRSAVTTLLAVTNPALIRNPPPQPASSPAATVEKNPEADREAQSLRQIYGVARSRIITGEEANKDAVKAVAGRCRVMHFAVPFAISNSRPMYSYLALAQGKTDDLQDGRWRVREMISLESGAGMMVFSASTAGPDPLRVFNGLTGLAWAAFVAGTPSVAASQWQVSSPATTELMTSFHDQMNRSGLRGGAATALQQAVLKLRRNGEYQHPFYWAGFVVSASK